MGTLTQIVHEFNKYFFFPVEFHSIERDLIHFMAMVSFSFLSL